MKSEKIPGVYLIYNKNDKLIYIGQSQDIKKRIKSHHSGSHKALRKQIDHYKYHRIVDLDQRKVVEHILINELSPFFNGWATSNFPTIPIKKVINHLDYFTTGEIMIYAFQSNHCIQYENEYSVYNLIKGNYHRMNYKQKENIHYFLNQIHRSRSDDLFEKAFGNGDN